MSGLQQAGCTTRDALYGNAFELVRAKGRISRNDLMGSLGVDLFKAQELIEAMEESGAIQGSKAQQGDSVLMWEIVPEDVRWYVQRDRLEPGQVFLTCFDSAVKLDRPVPGDGTQWYVADWHDGWAYYDSTIEPGDLRGEMIKDDPASIAQALDRLRVEAAKNG